MQTENSDSTKGRKSKTQALKIAGIASTTMWILGFVLLFVLKPDDKLIWTSDALLLYGFWPLLFVYKAGWTWFIFGILNMAIGFLLEVAKYLPPEAFPPDVLATKDHILKYHPTMVWIINGFFSALFGAFRIVRTIVKWVMKKSNKREP